MNIPDRQSQITELQKMVIAASTLCRRQYRQMVQTWPVGFYYLNHFQNNDELRYALLMIYSGIGACKAGSLTDLGFTHTGLYTLIADYCRKIQKFSGFTEGFDDDVLNTFPPEKRHSSNAESELRQAITDNLDLGYGCPGNITNSADSSDDSRTGQRRLARSAGRCYYIALA